ncbi:MAG: hypothetical protein KatS3mg114_1146 [Planctomycetaceae bacterium]|nr:MAG: hypothetical protein KatS3mg114_1146 [Planctomycetaceae bacterium]
MKLTLGHVPRLMRTVRHLRSSQLWWRTRYLLERRWWWRLSESGWRQHRAPAVKGARGPCPPLWYRPWPQAQELAAQLQQGLVTHLGKTVAVDPEHPDWLHAGDAAGRLWTVTWYYQGWVYELTSAWAAGDTQAANILCRWLDDWLSSCGLSVCGPAHLMWNAYAVATRIGWWVRSLDLVERRQLPLPGALHRRWLDSLASHVQYLSQHLEWDLRANHLLRDAVGLAWGGWFFQGRRARRWTELAREIVATQLSEQVLADGGHFERSPMYHLIVMEDFLTLSVLIEDPVLQQELRHTVQRMADWARWLSHPDGHLVQFNDAALEDSLRPSTIWPHLHQQQLCVETSRPVGLKHFPHSGLVVWHDDVWSLFWDVGDVGPDYQPGHAHADTLTLEVSFNGRRLIVDPGTYGYDLDARRQYDRSSAAHNTVTIAGHDSSEVWHIFRVGARARPLEVDVIPRRYGFTAWAAHTGYDALPGNPRHARQISLEFEDGRSRVRIIDHISGLEPLAAQGSWLLSPEWQVETLADGWRLRSPAGQLQVRLQTQPTVQHTVVQSSWHPTFGVEVPTPRLVWKYRGAFPLQVETCLEPIDIH